MFCHHCRFAIIRFTSKGTWPFWLRLMETKINSTHYIRMNAFFALQSEKKLVFIPMQWGLGTKSACDMWMYIYSLCVRIAYTLYRQHCSSKCALKRSNFLKIRAIFGDMLWEWNCEMKKFAHWKKHVPKLDS